MKIFRDSGEVSEVTVTSDSTTVEDLGSLAGGAAGRRRMERRIRTLWSLERSRGPRCPPRVGYAGEAESYSGCYVSLFCESSVRERAL